jgi:hypothetical protein
MTMLGLLLVNIKLLPVVDMYAVSDTNIKTIGSDVTLRLNSLDI